MNNSLTPEQLELRLKTKHTPGPWTCEKTNQGGWWIRRPGVAGFSISLIGKDDTPSHPAEANARLIAAAPEMFTILKMLQEDPYLFETSPEFCKKFDAVILQVEGDDD